MKPNTNITIYNTFIDPQTRSEKYQRSEIKDVTWQAGKAANFLKTGSLEADSVTIFIPYASGIAFVQPITWQALSDKAGKWTLQIGDFIVMGNVTDEVTDSFTISDLKRKYDDVVCISSVDPMDAINARLSHWEVGAK